MSTRYCIDMETKIFKPKTSNVLLSINNREHQKWCSLLWAIRWFQKITCRILSQVGMSVWNCQKWSTVTIITIPLRLMVHNQSHSMMNDLTGYRKHERLHFRRSLHHKCLSWCLAWFHHLQRSCLGWNHTRSGRQGKYNKGKEGSWFNAYHRHISKCVWTSKIAILMIYFTYGRFTLEEYFRWHWRLDQGFRNLVAEKNFGVIAKSRTPPVFSTSRHCPLKRFNHYFILATLVSAWIGHDAEHGVVWKYVS